MTHPRRYLIRMVVFLGAVLVLAVVLSGGIRDAFMANAALNGLIIGVLLLGIVYIFRTVFVLTSDVAWLESFRARIDEQTAYLTELDSAIPARASWRPRLDGDITINIVLPVEKTTHQLDFAHDAPVPLVKARLRASRRDPSHSSRIRALALREMLPLLVPLPREQERLAERTGVDASSQRLIYRNRVLDDPEARLASAGARARRRRPRALSPSRRDARRRANACSD